MKRKLLFLFTLLFVAQVSFPQQRRPIDNKHPLWLIHIDVWYTADPQKIIDLVPDDIKPYVCMNLSLSCQYDKDKNVYKMPQQAVRTYKSWATVCQKNGLWFTCQPASGGHTHIQDDDLETFEYFFKQFPNFLGWNYAEQFWGFDESGDKSSSPQSTRLALFANLVEMSHRYGGFLTVSYCGNIWSHSLNPVGMLKREPKLLEACQKYPEAMIWLYKYTTSGCFYNNESVSISPYISGLAENYGVRYDNCGWTSALSAIYGDNHGMKYPASAGIGTVMEQTGINGGAVWDGPELTWREECFHEVDRTTVDGYTRRNWEQFPNFNGVWVDLFRKVIDGTLYIPSRREVVNRTKIAVLNDLSAGSDEDKYAAWADLYDGVYKQDDPFNRETGQWMDNSCYFKKTGRYATIPICVGTYDDLSDSIPVMIKKSEYKQSWNTIAEKTDVFNKQYPEVSTGDLFVARLGNQLITYTPYSYLNSKTHASAEIPFLYNTCDRLSLRYDKLSSGVVREYSDHLDIYLNNFRTDTLTIREDVITIEGASDKPTYTLTSRNDSQCSAKEEWNSSSAAYTLKVSHIGPVDLVVKCSGDNERRDAPIFQALEIPAQPKTYRGPVVIEAEDMDYKNIKSCCTNPYYSYPDVSGCSGNGFVDFGTNVNGSLRRQFLSDFSGDFRIAVRYMTSKDGNLKVSVNGIEQTVPIEPSNNEWRKAVFKTTLQEGYNDLKIDNVEGVSLYVDQIVYTPDDVDDEKYSIVVRKTGNASVTTNMSEAFEGDSVVLFVEPDEGWELRELRVVNSVYYTQGATIPFESGSRRIVFRMPDDNLTILPVLVDVASIYKTNYEDVSSGSIPEGWRCLQENDELHEFPNTYSSGARMFVGFEGYQGKALYWREEYAEYGGQEGYALELAEGDYKLQFAMASWKTVRDYKVLILDSNGDVVAESDAFTADVSAEGSTSADVSSAERKTFAFSVSKQDDYRIRFVNESRSSGYDEFLLLECKLRTASVSASEENPYESTIVAECSLLPTVRVATKNLSVVVNGANGQHISIADVLGRVLFDSRIKDDHIEIPLNAPGTYMVKIGGEVKKITIR